MSETQIITLLGILVTAGTGLLVAYLHRKQMRQIEMFRLDPAHTSLVPPPHPLRVFVRSHQGYFMAIPSVGFLIYNLADQHPITRLAIFLIALNVAGILALVVLQFVERFVVSLGRVIRIQQVQMDLIESVVTLQKDHPARTIPRTPYPGPEGEKSSLPRP